MSAIPTATTDSVLVQSVEMPAGNIEIERYDFRLWTTTRCSTVSSQAASRRATTTRQGGVERHATLRGFLPLVLASDPAQIALLHSLAEHNFLALAFFGVAAEEEGSLFFSLV